MIMIQYEARKMCVKASVKKYEERRQRQRQRLKKNEQRSKSQEAGCCVRPVFAGGDLGELAGEGGRGRMVEFLTSNQRLFKKQSKEFCPRLPTCG